MAKKSKRRQARQNNNGSKGKQQQQQGPASSSPSTTAATATGWSDGQPTAKKPLRDQGDRANKGGTAMSPSSVATRSSLSKKRFTVDVPQINRTGSSGPSGTGPPAQPWDSERALPTRGLSNLGNTCFFNATLQNVFKTRLLHQALFGDPERRQGLYVGPLNKVFRRVLLEMGGEGPVGARHGAYSPSALLSAVQRAHPYFRGYHQHDAHELFMRLLGTLEDEEESFIKRRLEEEKEEQERGSKAVQEALAHEQGRDEQRDNEDVAGVGVDGGGKGAAGAAADAADAAGGVPPGTSSTDHESVSASASGDGVASGGDGDGGHESSGGTGRDSDEDGSSPVLPVDGDEINEEGSKASGRPAVSDAANDETGRAIDSEGRKIDGEDPPAPSPGAGIRSTDVVTGQSCGRRGSANEEEASSLPPVPETAKEKRARFKAQRRERQRVKKGADMVGTEGDAQTSTGDAKMSDAQASADDGETTDDSSDGKLNVLSAVVLPTPPPTPPPPPPPLLASLDSSKEESPAMDVAVSVPGPKVEDGPPEEEEVTDKPAQRPPRPAVTEVFGGLLASVVTCGACGARSSCVEPTNCLSLQIPPKKAGKAALSPAAQAYLASRKAGGVGKAAASSAASRTAAAATAEAAVAAVAEEKSASVGDGKPEKGGLGRDPSGRTSDSLTSVLPGFQLPAKERRKNARQERDRLRSMSSENEAAKAAKDTTGTEKAANKDDGDRSIVAKEVCSPAGGEAAPDLTPEESDEVRRCLDTVLQLACAGAGDGPSAAEISSKTQNVCAGGGNGGTSSVQKKEAADSLGKSRLDGREEDEEGGGTASGVMMGGESNTGPSESDADSTTGTCSSSSGSLSGCTTAETQGRSDDARDGGRSAFGSDCSDGSDCSVGSVSAESGVAVGGEENVEASGAAASLGTGDDNVDVDADNPADRLVEPPPRKEKSEHKQNPDAVDLYSCFDHFTAEESLVAADGNGYDCERCRSRSSPPKAVGDGEGKPPSSTVKPPKPSKQDAKKRLLMTGEPAGVLVCHLKRLQAQRKVNRSVEFPVDLDMAPYFWQDAEAPRRASEMEYRLFGVIEHRGNRSGGHYVAYVKDGEGWKHASDTSIRPAALPEVKNAKAYMLFYERCDQHSVSGAEATCAGSNDPAAAEPENDVAEQDNDVSEQVNDVAEQSKDVSERDYDVAEQSNDVAEQDNDVTEQDTDVAEEDKDVAEQSNDVAEQDNDVAEQDNNVAEQNNEVAEQDKNVAEVDTAAAASVV